jgi:succinate dehydrogenase / fumarate reductase cytochrome b subunit
VLSYPARLLLALHGPSNLYCAVKLLLSFWRSSIGKKWLVAITGVMLLGFVAGHLVGNLQMFAGPEKINAYAEFLHANEKLLWVARVGLIAAFGLHIAATATLVIQNKVARPYAYELERNVQAKISTRTMAYSGLTVLCFVVFHLLHYTLRVTDPRFKLETDGGLLASAHDVYRMVLMGFESPLVSGFYLLSVGLLSLHLSHGISSAVQTFGMESRKSAQRIRQTGRLLSGAIFVGYASIPAAVLLGYLK